MSEPFDLMGYIEEESQSGGGGGIITEVKIDGVWIVFHKGHMDKSYWVFNGKDAAVKTKETAVEYVSDNDVRDKSGKPARPVVGVRLTQYADSVLNREEPVNWTGGVIAKNFASFFGAYQKVIKPALEGVVGPDAQFSYGEKFWAQVGYRPDPDRPTWLDESTMEEKPNLVPYIVQAFSNRKEALEAAESDDSFAFVNIPDKPELYPNNDWDNLSRDMVKLFKEEPDTPVETFVDDSVGVTTAVVSAWRSEALSMEDLPF